MDAAEIYSAINRLKDDPENERAADFADFLKAAEEKHSPAPPVRQVYSLSEKQLCRLKLRYARSPAKGFSVIIDGEYVYCKCQTLSQFAGELQTMGVITADEAEIIGGKRHIPIGRITGEGGSKAIDSDALFDSGGWIDLLFPEGDHPCVNDYIAACREKIRALRVYNSDPFGALARDGEYFSFDPIYIREADAALDKVTELCKKIFSARVSGSGKAGQPDKTDPPQNG